ncbi:MAG: YggT family protein [Porticoccaceae bacterium]|jgi:YggT family protein
MNETLIFILKYATDIVATLLLIRFLLQLSQADFYNPVSQGILKICTPIAAPLEKLIPAMGRFNLAVLATAILVKWSFFVLIAAANGLLSVGIFSYLALAVFELLRTLITIYFYGVFILVIFSWVGTPPHPAARLINQVILPYTNIFRRFIPPLGMIDISPMVAIFTLMIIRAQILPIIAMQIRPLLM